MKNPLGTSAFARHAMTLMGGTVCAQMLPLMAAPLLSRIYGPSDLGVFAIFVAIASLFFVVITAKYEAAIPLPAKDEDAAAILALVILLSLAGSSVFLLGCCILHGTSSHLSSAGLGFWIYLLPVATMMMGTHQGLYYWANRCLHYRTMAHSMVAQNVVMIILAILLGLWTRGPAGLVLGLIAGKAASVLVLGATAWAHRGNRFRSLSLTRIRLAARRYVDFPKFSAPAVLVNLATMQTLLLLLGNFFGAAVVGMYALNQRVLGAPAALIGRTIGDVYRQRASLEFSQTGSCLRVYVKTFRALLVCALPVFVVLVLAAPALFEFVFGSQWVQAGRFAQIQSPLLLFGLVASPLGLTLHAAEKQKYDLFWQLALLVVAGSGTVAGCLLGTPEIAIGLFTASYVAMYVVYLAMSYHFADTRHSRWFGVRRQARLTLSTD